MQIGEKQKVKIYKDLPKPIEIPKPVEAPIKVENWPDPAYVPLVAPQKVGANGLLR